MAFYADNKIQIEQSLPFDNISQLMQFILNYINVSDIHKT